MVALMKKGGDEFAYSYYSEWRKGKQKRKSKAFLSGRQAADLAEDFYFYNLYSYSSHKRAFAYFYSRETNEVWGYV